MTTAALVENRSKERTEPELEKPTLEELVADIGRDARTDPGNYLRDSVVPEGGE